MNFDVVNKLLNMQEAKKKNITRILDLQLLQTDCCLMMIK